MALRGRSAMSPLFAAAVSGVDESSNEHIAAVSFAAVSFLSLYLIFKSQSRRLDVTLAPDRAIYP